LGSTRKARSPRARRSSPDIGGDDRFFGVVSTGCKDDDGALFSIDSMGHFTSLPAPTFHVLAAKFKVANLANLVQGSN
jgi:hypothetical protein